MRTSLAYLIWTSCDRYGGDWERRAGWPCLWRRGDAVLSLRPRPRRGWNTAGNTALEFGFATSLGREGREQQPTDQGLPRWVGAGRTGSASWGKEGTCMSRPYPLRALCVCCRCQMQMQVGFVQGYSYSVLPRTLQFVHHQLASTCSAAGDLRARWPIADAPGASTTALAMRVRPRVHHYAPPLAITTVAEGMFCVANDYGHDHERG